jgi:phosphate transport system permease protein
MTNLKKLKEKSIHGFFGLTATVSIVILGMIMLFLFWEGLPIFGVVPVKDFLLGREWYPTSDPADFGICR